MSKKKNLERAIVLGLILSTGVYGNAWAETINDFKNTADNNSNIVVDTDTTVDGTGYYGPDVSSGSGVEQPKHILKNSLFEIRDGKIVNMTVTAGNVKLTFNDVNMLSPHIVKAEGTNGADIYIVNDYATTDTANSNKDFAGINVSAYIEGNSLTVDSIGRGIYTGVGKNAYPIIVDGHEYRNVYIDVNNQVKITSASDGIFNEGENESDVTITAGSVIIDANARNGIYNAAGRNADLGNNVSVTAENGNIEINLKDTTDRIDLASVKNTTYGKTELTALNGAINLDSTRSGIWATKGEVSLKSGLGNSISAKVVKEDKIENNKDITVAEQGFSVYAEGGSKVDLSVTEDETGVIKGDNVLAGAVYASGIAVKEEGQKVNNVTLNSKSNNVYSHTVIDNAGDINTKDGEETNKFFGKRFVSALYAEDGANIELTGENKIGTWADNRDSNTLERTVWAYSSDDTIGSSISFDGAVQIGTDSYSSSPNSADVAIAAGTATDLTKDKVDGFVNDPNAKRSTVTIEYDDFKNAEGNYAGSSYISGDILSAYAGQVDIKGKSADVGIKITGNLLAGNNGILNVDLGNGGYLAGRIDDYQDAGTNNTEAANGHLNFYNPEFSSTIYGTGTVKLDMGKNSYWRVTGQSWVTSISGDNATIDMRNSNNADTTSHAVHVGTLTGNHTFVMDLNDANHNISDMLYIKDEANSSGIQTVYLNTVEGLENMQDGDKLRFATVNAGTEQLSFIGEYNGENGYSPARSRVMLYDTGFNNAAFEIGNETYSEADTENSGYNGASFNETKPGDAYVDAEYGDGATNWYITRNSSGDEISDAGKTMLNMSRANYSNAIYMDRLNKRLGEARYINSEEDEGMWVRIRHDRIGKDDAYRSQNTMYELGYDQKQECDNGERRVGMAIDYMHGDTGYNDIAGKGEIDRYGLWLYDTWMGDKGHYADYVAKWGHLSNDFEIYNSRGEVTGDYSNNVFSVSAEYGRKKDIGNDWYFEPQVQAQLARVTGADYTTSQGTKVSVDGINSLIGRAGFRLGKDFGAEKQSTVYIKADILHEFLGDQDIRAFDGTTSGWQTVSYENEGTWYDVGLGFAAMMSKSSYAFLDLERSFGHDNDETYQINVGMQWSF